MKPVFLFVVMCAIFAPTAHGQPVKCVDEKGRTRYIDQSMAAQEKCKPVTATTNMIQMQPGAINLQQPPPKPDDSAKNQAAITQAENRLNEAKAKLAEQESTRSGNEKNYERVLERLKPYQDAVDQAQKNLDDLRNKR